MAVAKVEEYASVGMTAGPALVQVPAGPPLRVQTVTFTTSAASTGNSLLEAASLFVVTLDDETPRAFMKIRFGDDATEATSADMHLFGGTYRAFLLKGGAAKFFSFVEP